MVYIAFLRGINVGGHTVKMEYLRELFTQLGHTNVRSYIQSGNIFFETSDKENRETLTKNIQHHLHKALGYEVPVCLRTITELEHIISLDPFKHVKSTPEMRLCIVFTTDVIPHLDLPMHSPKNDMEIIDTTKHEAFVVWHIINGRPPTVAFQEKIFGKNTTIRFYHTLIKILDAAKKES